MPARRALGPWFQTTGFQPFSLSVGGEVRRKLLNPPAKSWWSFSVVVTLSVPFTPLGKRFGLSQLSMVFHLLLGSIVMLYILTAEMVKTVFYTQVKL